MKRIEYREGELLGSLIFVSEAEKAVKSLNRRAVFKCRCGNIFTTAIHMAKSGQSTSCGCEHKRMLIERLTKHGCSSGGRQTSEYTIWKGIVSRCENPKERCYKHYGGRGVIMCERWRSNFSNFLEDVGPRPSNKHSLDRIDVNGNYEPGNCRWATQIEQMNNMRKNRRLTYNGESKTVSEWTRHLGFSKVLLHQRIFSYGWSVEEALSTPVGGKRDKPLSV